MKKRLTLAAALAATIVMTGCMSEREYQLRKNDIDAKKEWKPTYQILSIKGPLNVPEGGELIINAPSQPFVPTNIPDGQAYQLRALTTTEAIGAAAFGGYLIKSAKGTTTKNNNVTNNNGGAE